MVQIGNRRKKKGRPVTKPDPDRRAEVTRREVDVPQRRSTRRRNLTYNEDFYDEIFEEEEEEEDEDDDDDDDDDEIVRKREKKVRSVMKIPDKKVLPICKRVEPLSRTGRGGGGGRGNGRRRVEHVSAPELSSSSSSSDDETKNNKKPFKKRKIEEEDDEEEFCEQNDEDDYDDGNQNDAKPGRSRDQNKFSKINGVTKKLDAVQPQGKMSDSSKGIPLPERQQLELILDKLQKKDTYGVYAEPVDPEELPDYHDVIEHPMDFGTIRKKLAKGTYSELEQFESDIDLICTNAMQYNAPETIYFKQARSIQDLARKKFDRLKTEFQGTVAEFKSEETVKTNSIMKKPTMKPPCKVIQEPVGSDFSSGATLAAAADICTLSNATPTRVYEKPSTVDMHVDKNSSLTESKPEKVEEQISGKGFPSKLGRKPFVIDENRRATYNISNQAVVRTESMCTIFEDEKTQLVSVGVHGDHAYARSLARFAATLGPVAWKVASQRIEHALPGDIKFGRGWVGDYEPLPTPVLMLENRTQTQPRAGFPTKSTKDDKGTVDMKGHVSEPCPTPVQMSETQRQWQPRNNPLQIENKTQRQPGSISPVPLIENQTQRRPGNSSQVSIIENQTRWRPSNSSQGKTDSQKDKFAEGSMFPKKDVYVGPRTTDSPQGKTDSQKDKFAEGSMFPKKDVYVGPRTADSPRGKTDSQKDKFAEGSLFPKKDVFVSPRTTESAALVAPKMQDSANERQFSNTISGGKLGFIGVSGTKSVVNAPFQPQSSSSMNNGRSENTVLKQLHLNQSIPASGNLQGHVPPKQLERTSEVTTSRLLDVVSRNQNLVQSVPFKQSEANGVGAGRVPNGIAGINPSNHQASTLSYAVGSNQQARAAMYFPHANHEQGLSDPVQMMRILAHKTQNQQKPINFAAIDSGQNKSSEASLRRDDTNGAATAAARAWMTLGATHFKAPEGPGSPKLQIAASSLYNSEREVPQSIMQNREEILLSRGKLQSKNNNFPPQMFLPQPNRAANEALFQNNRQMVFPQLVTTDLSRFQGQSPWQGLRPHTQQNKKQDSLPPDLNISFQSSGSPRQSAGAMVDSQQPDLALQL